jgi:uncharacterized protein
MPTSFTIGGAVGQPDLEGVWVRAGEAVAVVAAPHPLMGGHLSNPVVAAVAEGLRVAGISSLLFNYRGVGESGGDPSGDPEDADADFRAALVHAEKTATVVVAAGYSFGGAAAIRVASRHRPLGVFAVAPPAGLLPPHALAALGEHVTIVAGERDSIASAEALSSVVRTAPGVRLTTLASADHFFGRQLGRLSELACELGERVQSRSPG